MIIKRIGPLSCAKLSGLLYAVIGLVLGGIFSLVAVAGGFASDTAGAGGVGAIIGVGAVIVFPILYGLMGFVATLVAAWLYNVVAGIVGGVEVDIQ
ncbi:MAG: hypothetical protein EHM55_21870 [Acidobacteria bacterium]|nr:MAG: hypothetical protein EHM55_21870 [Acidobacteriota bacterium]